MSDSPLAILGLSPERATAPEIKAAYARLIKAHRPDVDPEGFKRLRSAYEAALSAGQGAAKTIPYASPNEAAPKREVELTTGAEAAVTELRHAIESRARQRVRDSWSKLDTEAAYLPLRERFHLAMSVFSGAPVTLLAEVCSDERLLAHIQDGDVQLAHAALKGWTEQRDARRIREFIGSLNRARSMHSLPECAIVMVWTAVALAAWEPETANRLAQKSFPALPPQNRAELMQRVDLEVSLGRMVAALPETDKFFWLACLRGKPPSASWGDQEGRRLLVNLMRLCGAQWPGFQVLAATLPPDHWLRLKAAINTLL